MLRFEDGFWRCLCDELVDDLGHDSLTLLFLDSVLCMFAVLLPQLLLLHSDASHFAVFTTRLQDQLMVVLVVAYVTS